MSEEKNLRCFNDTENDLKTIDVKKLEKNSERYRHLEMDPEGGHGPTWTAEPVEREGERNKMWLLPIFDCT
jgi:hypothetical protein